MFWVDPQVILIHNDQLFYQGILRIVNQHKASFNHSRSSRESELKRVSLNQGYHFSVPKDQWLNDLKRMTIEINDLPKAQRNYPKNHQAIYEKKPVLLFAEKTCAICPNGSEWTIFYAQICRAACRGDMDGASISGEYWDAAPGLG